MKKKRALLLRSGLLAGGALLACSSSHAVITCSVASNGFASAYVPANPGINVTSASLTMTCTRNLAGDATSQAFTVKADNGLYSSGQTNQAASGANRIRYDTFLDSGCVTQWKGNTTLGGTINLGAVGIPSSQTLPFWGCIPAAQTTVPAGTFADTVTITPNIGLVSTFPVSIVTPSSCSITSPPTNMTFNYTAFQGSPATAVSNFSTTCTSRLPYSMALDATSSVLAGLAYSLSLSGSSSVGTGVAQPYTINGTMAGGQSGVCAIGACTATEPRTLTITY